MLHCSSITRLMSAVIALWQHYLYHNACCATLGLQELCLIALWQHYLTNFSICLIMPLSVHLIVLLYCASLVLQLDSPPPTPTSPSSLIFICVLGPSARPCHICCQRDLNPCLL